MLYMLVYIPMIVPATWLLNHYGLRVSILIGATLNVLGAWIKCLSMELSQPVSSPSSNASFPLLMVAQLVCALGQVFLLGVPAQLAATWFSKSELAMATAIGVFGNQVGKLSCCVWTYDKILAKLVGAANCPVTWLWSLRPSFKSFLDFNYSNALNIPTGLSLEMFLP